MEIKLAQKYGFCFGVKRAIKIAETNKGSVTLGPLIHNPKEIKRLKQEFDVDTQEDMLKTPEKQNVIIRTHGIEKKTKEALREKHFNLIDATCPYVAKPQEIAQKMSDSGYKIIIFGDANHPEVKGVGSYAKDPIIINSLEKLTRIPIPNKIALISQTTAKPQEFSKIASHLAQNCKETRIFNTICSATFENQQAIDELSKKVDIVIVVGGKNSSNTKQLLSIAKKNCNDSYLVEDETELDMTWFDGKKTCGISAGASTPDWIIENVTRVIRQV